MAHSWGTINLDDINSEKGYNNNKAYSQSKLANILFTYLQAKKVIFIIWLMYGTLYCSSLFTLEFLKHECFVCCRCKIIQCCT